MFSHNAPTTKNTTLQDPIPATIELRTHGVHMSCCIQHRLRLQRQLARSPTSSRTPRGRPSSRGKTSASWTSFCLIEASSFIGRFFYLKKKKKNCTHAFPCAAGEGRFFIEADLHPNDCTFGDISVTLVADFGQNPGAKAHPSACCISGAKTSPEALVLERMHRSRDDLCWSEL